jgi:aerobic carbon-monoxide dehydrogenase small subunit
VDAASTSITLTVNGRPQTVSVEPRTLLVQVLRESLGLTGTKVGCDTSQCGACTAHLDGRAVKSCTILAVQAAGQAVTTIEGVGSLTSPHPVQRAFVEHDGLQCGFCTSGMIMTTLDLLERDPDPDADTVRHALAGNLCRCTGYHTIVDAVLAAAAATRGNA